MLDSPLWKLLFRLEGWNSNFQQVHAYEDAEKRKRAEGKEKERKTRPRAVEDMRISRVRSLRFIHHVRSRSNHDACPMRQRMLPVAHQDTIWITHTPHPTNQPTPPLAQHLKRIDLSSHNTLTFLPTLARTSCSQCRTAHELFSNP